MGSRDAHRFLGHFLVGFEGITLPDSVADMLADGLAGVVLFKRNIQDYQQVKSLVTRIMQAGGPDRIIAVDQEGGLVQRLRDIGTNIPSATKLAQKGPGYVHRVAGIMGSELAALGFNLDFAPVLDVKTRTGHPIIGDRSFSFDPFVCATMGNRVIAGLQAKGVMACGKHFPGHGGADADSHKALPVVNHSYQTMTSQDLVPFRSAVGFGVQMIMTAHCMYPQIDDESPATLSKSIIEGLLRGTIGFEGVVVSDDLEMKAIADRYTLKDTLKQGVISGVDLFMFCSKPDLARQGADYLETLYKEDDFLLKLNDSYNRIGAVHQWILGKADIRKRWFDRKFTEIVMENAAFLKGSHD